ncbi:prmA [Symbiodinium sp. CCMP2456]|nr:prmA [Symbiodinium sp. CCMP2456]
MRVAAGVPLSAVDLQELDWSKFEDAASMPALPQPPAQEQGQHWDLLIGSDLIYSQAGVDLLPRVLKEFARQWPSAMMLYCHTLHRFDDFDLEFCRELRRQGLVYDIVAAAGAERKEDAGDELDPLADDCAGFLQELFPEKRIVVFHIHLPHQFANDGCLTWSASLARSVPPVADRIDEPSVQSCRDREGSDDVVKVGRVSIFLPVEGMEDRELPSGEDGVVIRLRALGPFGSGQHPTTALVLQAMQDLDWANIPTVCDYGCGSGVLGLVALGLGARQCLGVDNVPDALTAAHENLKANLPRLKRANGDEPRMQLHLPPKEMLDKDLDFYTRHGDWRHSMTLQGWTPVEVTEGSFDLVVANIVIGPLCQSAPMVKRLLRAGGQVLLAGMREFQVKQGDEAYGQDFDLKVINTLDGWALVHGLLRRPCRDEECSLMQDDQKLRAQMSVLASGIDLCCFRRPSAPPAPPPPGARPLPEKAVPPNVAAHAGLDTPSTVADEEKQQHEEAVPDSPSSKGPKGGKGPGKGPGKGQAKGGKAPEPAMTYKQKQEAELAAKEESLTAPNGFAGKEVLSDWELKVLAGATDQEEGPYSGRKFMPTRGYFACVRCGSVIYLAQAKFVH